MRPRADRIKDNGDLRRRTDGAHMEHGLQNISNRVSRTRRVGRLAFAYQMVCSPRHAHESVVPLQRQIPRYRRIMQLEEFCQLTDGTLIPDQLARDPQALNGEIS